VVAALLVLACTVPGFAQKAGVGPRKAAVIRLDKAVDFAKFQTYSYEKGQPAIRPDVDARIVSAIEGQLGELGLTKATSGPGDVIVTYYSVTRTDVNLATFDKNEPPAGTERKPAQTFEIGTLVVDVKPSTQKTPAWRVKVEGALTGDYTEQLKTVDEAVRAAFRMYPTKIAERK
jgi:hypothetical protein